MSYLMSNDFNWDDIDVGNHVLDHSQNFFQQNHNKHEGLEESKEMDFIKEIDALTFESNQNKENVEERINASNPDNKTIKYNDSPVKSPLREQQSKTTNAVVLSESLILRNKARINPSNKRETPAESNLDDDVHTEAANPGVPSESLIMRNKARINPGVKKDNKNKPVASPTTSSNTSEKGAMPKQSAEAPHAYQCIDVYKRRKEEQLKKRLEEERKMREFHSRPVPNFTACHKSLQDKKFLHMVTVPVTPNVLKNSRVTEEKRKQKLDQLKLQQPPKFEPRPPTSLYEKPFVPKKTQTVLNQCPFKLNCERRLQERKQYDATIQRVMEEKQKQAEMQEEERRRVEELRIKEMRKLTQFKARPNPFK